MGCWWYLDGIVKSCPNTTATLAVVLKKEHLISTSAGIAWTAFPTILRKNLRRCCWMERLMHTMTTMIRIAVILSTMAGIPIATARSLSGSMDSKTTLRKHCLMKLFRPF